MVVERFEEKPFVRPSGPIVTRGCFWIDLRQNIFHTGCQACRVFRLYGHPRSGTERVEHIDRHNAEVILTSELGELLI